MISKREAEDLARKLGSEPSLGGKHFKVEVFVDGKLEKIFGFSHDAKKPNPHIAQNLGISRKETQRLARCHLSREWYFGLLRRRRRQTRDRHG